MPEPTSEETLGRSTPVPRSEEAAGNDVVAVDGRVVGEPGDRRPSAIVHQILECGPFEGGRREGGCLASNSALLNAACATSAATSARHPPAEESRPDSYQPIADAIREDVARGQP